MMSVELRTPGPGSGFGGAAADLSLTEQLAGGTPGAAEAKRRSFGDELDDSLLESEADHEPPACTACPAPPLPLAGALRAVGPLIDPSWLAGNTVEEVTPSPPTNEGAVEPIASTSPAPAPVDTAATSEGAETTVAAVAAGTDVTPEPPVTPGAADPAASHGPDGNTGVPEPAVEAGGRERVSDEQEPSETPPPARTGPIAQKRSSDDERPSGSPPGPARDSGQTISRAAPGPAQDNGQTISRAAPGPARDSGQTISRAAPGHAQDNGQTITRPAGSRIGTESADTPEDRFVAGERRPMTGPAGSTDRADSSPGAQRSPIGFAAVEGRAGAATHAAAAAPERVSAGHEQPWHPLAQAESAPTAESSPRSAAETVFRPMPVGPPPPAPQVTVTQPVAELADAPRVAVAPETADSIVQSMRLQYQRGGGDAVVHIKPEHLGPVSVSLRVENGAVSAVVHAESGEVADWLKSNEQLLREGLASSGLHLERFAVRRDGHPPDRRPWRPPEPPERRRRGLQPESTFEISV